MILVQRSRLLWFGLALILSSSCCLFAAARPFSLTESSRHASCSYKATPFGLPKLQAIHFQPCLENTAVIRVFDIRGGNLESTPTSSGTTTHTLLERAGPYWNSFSKFINEKTKLVQEKVEPAISDPKTNLWDPLKQFLRNQKQVAQERTITVQRDPKQAAVLLFSPTRFIKIGIAAWILAEVLHGIGFFDNPEGVGPKLKELYREHLDVGVNQVRYRVLDWWDEERDHGGWLNIHTYKNKSILSSKVQQLPRRYQFALGGAIGMILSPVAWILSIKITKFFAITYIFSELNEYWRDSSSVGESAIEVLGFRGKGGDRINDFLDSVREGVRSTILYPEKFWEDINEVFTKDDRDGLSAGTKKGLLFGIVIGVIV